MYNLSIELTIPLLIIVGLLSSLLASMIGLGGGITAIPFIMLIIGNHSLEAKLIGYVSISFLSIIASFKYYKLKKSPRWLEAFLIIVGLIPATVISELYLGSILNQEKYSAYFHLLYAIVTIIAVIIVNLKDKLVLKNKIPFWLLPLFGVFTGVLAGSCGISGGVIFVPILVVGLKENLKQAAVTSLVLKLFASLANIMTGAISGQYNNFENNGVYWFLPLVIIIGAFIGSQIGPILNKKVSEKTIHVTFNVVMSVIIIWELLKMILGILGIY